MRLQRVIIAALICLLVGVGIVYARDIEQGDQCVIGPEREISGNLLVLCRTLVVDGHITGNLIGAATTAVINGRIDGNVYMLAGQMDVHGSIGDDLHFAGLVLRVHQDAEFTARAADLVSISLSTTLLPESGLSGTILSVGYQLILQGRVAGEVNFWGSSLLITGVVDGNVYAQVGDANADVSQLETLLIPVPLEITLSRPGLRVGDNARITGELRYSGPTEAEIAAGTLETEPIYTPIVVQPDFTQIALGEQDQSRELGLFLSQVVREFLTLMLVGGVLLLLAPRSMQAPLRNLQARPLVCIGVGLLAFIISFVAVPFIMLLTALIIIVVSLLQVNELTLAIGAMLVVADIGIGAVVFFVVLFVSRVVFCLALGRLVVRFLVGDNGTLRRALLALLIGAAALALVASLPAIGWLLNAIALFLGLGAILTTIQARAEPAPDAAHSGRRITIQPPSLPRGSDELRTAPPPPPPIIDTNPQPLGMDNLPAGFTWWDDED